MKHSLYDRTTPFFRSFSKGIVVGIILGLFLALWWRAAQIEQTREDATLVGEFPAYK